jgi:hypothetical protein
MSDPREWPALASLGSGSGSLRYRRAIHGKVHRAPTDYRWIAASGEFESPRELLETSTIGGEDNPAGLFCWRPVARGYTAIRGYPSRARDAAGRPGGLEKQFGYWEEDRALPAAAAAFLLLDAASNWDDTLWWDTWSDPRWLDLSYRLAIGPEQCRPLVWNLQTLGRLIDEGLTELKAAADLGALTGFYEQILSGNQPTLLSVRASLPPLAVAALLLPLSREKAGSLSVAGWLPSRQFRADRLTNWTAVACPGEPPAGQQASERAQSLARSIVSGRPEPSARSAESAVKSGGMGASGRSTAGEPLSGILKAFLASESRVWDPAQLDIAACPTLALSESLVAIAALRTYDRAVEEDNRFPSDELRQTARREHLNLKGDMARALLYVMAPEDRIVNKFPPREKALVPALWFAPLLNEKQWERFDAYSADTLVQLVRHSVDVRRLRDPLGHWLQQYLGTMGGGERQERISRVLSVE